MSNYSSLKATINANVKQNNNQEITGNVLNSVLNQMVTSLGAGFQYQGKATPSGSPGSPDNNVFYMAEPGTYTNYGNAVVPDGHIGMLSYDGSWHLDTIEVMPAEIDTEQIADAAITEAKLASALITKLMQTGYKLAGVATPSTNPGTPDQNVFYLAAPGSYTHFGSSTLTVNDGYIGVIKWGGSSWSLDQIRVGDVDTVKYTAQTLADSEKAQARTNIGAADENIVKQITNAPLTEGVYSTGATLDPQKQSGDYYSVLIKAAPGTTFIIAGRGGSHETRRLWATYTASGNRNRIAEASINTTSNPATITLSDTECYIIVNTLSTAIGSSAVMMIDIAANLVQIITDVENLATNLGASISILQTTVTRLDNEVQDLDGKIGEYGSADYTIEQGSISYSQGVNTTNLTKLRTAGYISAETVLKVNPGSGKIMLFQYDADNNYLGHTNWIQQEDIYSFVDVAKYRIIFSYIDESTITPSDFASLGASVYAISNGEMVRTTPQYLTLVEQETARKNIGAIAETEVNPITDGESIIDWVSNRFIRSDSTIINTSVANEVGNIAISGYRVLEFNYFIKGGGSGNRYGYIITDAGGNVLLHSEEYPSSRNSGPFDIVLEDIPSSAAFLYISWSAASAGVAHYLRCHADIGLLYERVSALEGGEDETQEVNIENAAIQLYRTVRYNNNDYSYTRLPYLTALINFPDAWLPTPVEFPTQVDSSAQSRAIMIADNSGYDNSYTLSLDLVSERVQVSNLEPGKDYYYKVYKNGDAAAIINGGVIKTAGQIRTLNIAADPVTNGHSFVDNVRDIGGWPASGNRRMRYGVIFRGEQLNKIEDNVETVYITNEGKQELLRLGVSAELDLRGNPSVYTHSIIGNNVAYANFALDLWFYRINIYNTIVDRAQLFASAIRQILSWIEGGKTVYIHCAGGCDRTGALCTMMEGLCGVSENDINHDYEISNRTRNREYYHIEGNTDPDTNKYDGDFKFAIEYIKGLIEYNDHIYVYYRGNYYDAEATVTDYTPVPLTDTTLTDNLAANNFGSLQDRFERLMCGVGGLTKNEVQRLRTVLCS